MSNLYVSGIGSARKPSQNQQNSNEKPANQHPFAAVITDVDFVILRILIFFHKQEFYSLQL